MLLGVVLIIGSLYLTQYVYTLVVGSFFQVAQDTVTPTAVKNDSTIANNESDVAFAHSNIVIGTLAMFNETNGFEWGLGNFTIYYENGSYQILNPDEYLINSTKIAANYTYNDTVGSPLRITQSTREALRGTESTYFSTANYINSGASFAGALISIAVIMIVFGGFLALGYGAYKKYYKRGGDRDF